VKSFTCIKLGTVARLIGPILGFVLILLHVQITIVKTHASYVIPIYTVKKLPRMHQAIFFLFFFVEIMEASQVGPSASLMGGELRFISSFY
jgi:hypothetical protein